ncbi:MAG TPA: hypothetical protein VJH68_04265 [Candidatus Nanoarchaeia archaeon]|nr:hypothetical protein [Candidatus Nanoarchaeia archaeon]
MRPLIAVFLLITLAMILGCTANWSETVMNDSKNDSQNSSELEKEAVLPAMGSEGPCPGRFICLSYLVSAYQDENCQITNRTTCETECAEGLCQEKEIKICVSGFKCRNNLERGFQREDCRWEKKEKCEFGCNISANKCFNASTAPVAIISEQEKTVSRSAYPVLALGQVLELANGNLSIYVLEAERVQLRLGQQKSGWLQEGDSIIFKNGLTVTVREILFQAYAEGKKQVVYSTSTLAS